MNALPLPTGPMEIPGGAPKTQRSSLNADKYGRVDDRDSFASTLKAVHEGNRTESDIRRTQTREVKAERDNNEVDDPRPVEKEDETAGGEESAQAMPAPRKSDENPEGEEASAASATGKREDGVNPQAENAESGGVRISALAGVQSREATPKKTMTTVNTRDETTANKSNPEAADAAKATSETIAQTPADLSPQSPKPASPTAADAANLAAEDSSPADPKDLKAKGLQEKKTAATVLPANSDDTEDKALGTEDSLATGDGDAGKSGRNAMRQDAKQLPGRAEAINGEASRDVPKHTTHAEPQAIPAEHPSNGETPSHSAEKGGEAGRETLSTTPHGANSQTVERQAPIDSTLSYTAATAATRVESVSPGAGTATTMAAATDRFHQDNFNQLVERAIFAVRGEQSEARIALKPDQLGHVQMRVVTEHHLVSIKITTESTAARDLIDTHAHQLKAELQQQGLTVEHIEVSVSNGQGDAYRGERQRELFLRQMASQGQSTPEEDLSPLPPDIRQSSAGQDRSRGIDYFA